MLFLFAPNGVRATAYLSAADWLAALPNTPIVIESFPTYTTVVTDAFGSKGPFANNNGGEFTGNFFCNSAVYPCLGAFQITYTLPFEIIGFAGDLNYANGWYATTPVFPVPLSLNPYNQYHGFYGEIFDPTATITLVWKPGLISTDSFANFQFDLPVVVRAVPEPAALFLFISGLLGLSLVTIRNTRLTVRTNRFIGPVTGSPLPNL